MNVLDFTAVTFPVGYIDMELDPGQDSFASLGKEDEGVHQSCEFYVPMHAQQH